MEFVVCITILWLVLVSLGTSQTPPVVSTMPLYGYTCDPFDLSLLGSRDMLSTSGLVPRHLQYETTWRYTDFMTTALPSVQILEAKVVCESIGVTRDKRSSATVFVHYTCVGMACLSENSVIANDLTAYFPFGCKDQSLVPPEIPPGS